MNEELERKIKGIVGLYNFYKYQMNTPQRVALLTLWVEICVTKEEYWVADVLQTELNKILRGEEDYYLTAPADTNLLGPASFSPPSMDTIKEKVILSMGDKPKKKKLKWVNYWGSGSFHVFNLSFGDFKFVVLNIGVELR